MGECQACVAQAEYVAIDADWISNSIKDQPVGAQIQRLRNSNQAYVKQFSFTPAPDRSFYRGKLVNLKRQGYGELYHDRFNYYGHFKNNLPHGQGAIITEERCMMGNFEQGHIDGQGKQWNKDFTFEGEYEMGVRVKGTLKEGDLLYTGDFVDDKFSGNGELRMPLGTYEGPFVNGLFDGDGTVRFANGNVYHGTFKAGRYHGYGQFVWKNGNSYRGEYINGLKHGFGVLELEHLQYRGEWIDGKRQGKGLLGDNEDLNYALWKEDKLIDPQN